MTKPHWVDIPRQFLNATFIGLLSLALGACGGGGSSSPPPPPADFTISTSPSNLVVAIGGSQTVTISASAINGFSSAIGVTVSGLPSGVTATPSTVNVTPAAPGQLLISAGASLQPVTAALTFQGTSGSLSHNTQASLSVVAPVSGMHPGMRTRYLRTNLLYNPTTLQSAPPRLAVYDAAQKQFFVSNPFMNEIDVFDATQEIGTAQISIPMPWVLDISPLDGTLYAATMIGDIYHVNTSTLSVITRYPAASIGPSGFQTTSALVLSDGRLALQGGVGKEVALLGGDGYGVSVVWDPVTNSMDTGADGSVCDVIGEGAFALSGDRTRILVTTVDTATGAGEPVCSYDPVARMATYGVFPFPNVFVRQIIPTPDGSRFFLTSTDAGVGVFDAKTVEFLGQIPSPNPVGSGIPDSAVGAVISLDGTTLYLADQLSGAIGAYDTTALTQTGWVPSFTVNDIQAGVVVGAIDDTGLIVGPIGHGVGFLDATLLTGVEPTLIAAGAATPSMGPLAGNTTVTNFLVGKVTDSASLSATFVGNVPGISASFSATPPNENDAQATTPPSNQPGPVDLAITLSDGAVGLDPEGFSYGPSILEVVPNGATADGGQTGTIIGYGFGESTSGVQVTVGGQSAAVTAVGTPETVYPFPVNWLHFTIPPGTAGSAVDVTVTTSAGSVTASGAFHYTAAVQSYPLTANLQSGLYDAGRDLYLFADQAQIQVFSKTAGNWLSPIPLPSTSSKTQLSAIAESPDGTKLAVSDSGGQAIYVLNPDNPASALMYPMSLDNDGDAASMAPAGLAVTDAGMVYFTTRDLTGSGLPDFHKLDTSSASITDLGYALGLAGGGSGDQYSRVLISPDGSKIYSGIEGACFSLDTSDDKIYFSNATTISGDFPNLGVSGDGGTAEFSGELTDGSLNPETEMAYIDWETWFPVAANGQKLNQDGSFLLQLLTDGIDMVARNTGKLLYRIQIPVTPANVYDALVVGPGTNVVAVITPTGISFVDLSSLPISSLYTQPFAVRSSRPKSIGRRSVVEKRGLHKLSTYWPTLRQRVEAVLPTKH